MFSDPYKNTETHCGQKVEFLNVKNCWYYYYTNDEIEKNEMGVARSTYEGEERCIQGCGREN